MLHSDPNACQLTVRSLLGRGEFPSGWLFFSAGEFPAPLARTLEILHPCTTPSPVDRRCLPRRRSSCRAFLPAQARLRKPIRFRWTVATTTFLSLCVFLLPL